MKKKGYITLLSVLVVGAVGGAIAISVVLLGLGSSRTSLAYQQLVQARALSSACAEEGLEQMRSTPTFAGSGTLTIGAGTCTYAVTNQGGENRTVHATGTVQTMVRKIKVIVVDLQPTSISSWQEIP